MKKWVGLLIVLSLAASVHAGLDISFSSDNGGNWTYESTTEREGVFSFTVADIDNEQGAHDNDISGGSLYIPDLIVSNLNETSLEGIYIGDIVPKDSTIGIKGSDDNLVLSGELGSGHILVAGTTASLYYNFKSDITNTAWGKYSGPTITTLDFSLTLQGSIDIASIINSQTPISNKGGTFSGSISVPEPATFFILAFGSVLFWRKEKTA